MSTLTESVSSNLPQYSRWLNATRGLAFGSLVIAAIIGAMHADDQNFMIVFPTAPLWLPFLWMFGLLMGKTTWSQRRGLALAVAIGPYPLIFSFFFAAASDTRIWQAGFASYAVLHLLLMVSAVRTYYSMKREPGDWGLLSRRLVGGVFILVGAGVLIPHMMVSRVAQDEAFAVHEMRTINIAQSVYAEKNPDKGFASTLCELGPGPDDSLIDQQRASGRKTHYTFVMSAGSADSHGRVTQYTVVARPEKFEKDGVRSFFTDESGIIRCTADDRQPTVFDPPL